MRNCQATQLKWVLRYVGPCIWSLNPYLHVLVSLVLLSNADQLLVRIHMRGCVTIGEKRWNVNHRSFVFKCWQMQACVLMLNSDATCQHIRTVYTKIIMIFNSCDLSHQSPGKLKCRFPWYRHAVLSQSFFEVLRLVHYKHFITLTSVIEYSFKQCV